MILLKGQDKIFKTGIKKPASELAGQRLLQQI